MVQTPRWTAVSASAYVAVLALLVLHLDGVVLTISLSLVVMTGSVGLVWFSSSFHPTPAVTLADHHLHVVLLAVPTGVLIAVHLPGPSSISPVDPTNWLLLFWTLAGVALFDSIRNAQARYYERRSGQVAYLCVRPTFRTRRRRTAFFGITGVVLVTVGYGLALYVSPASSSFVMGAGFMALFSGVFSARRSRTYRLLDDGLVRQDNGAIARSFVPHSRIETAACEDEELCLERRGLWYPKTAFVIEDVGGKREAAARWFELA